MLEKYKTNYNEFYSIINNAIEENKISHAYMFELDDNLDQEEFIKDICKILILENKEKDTNIYTLIDNNNYPNIKIVKPDGLWIKKEQILEVQSDFKKESFDNNRKIYIIDDATRLNKSSGNTLLKFLEEPEKNITAILLTKNKYAVIPTIMSRCININLIKKEYINILENAQKIYIDFLHINNNIDKKYNYFVEDGIKDIKFDTNNDLLIKKIEALRKNTDYLRYNVNVKTVLDKIVIEIYGGDLDA